MDDGDSDSLEPPPNKRRVIVLYSLLALGFSIVDTYLIVWIADGIGDVNITLYNAAGALLALIIAIGVAR